MKSSATLQDLVRSFSDRGAEPAIISFSEKGKKTWSYKKLAKTISLLGAGLLDKGVSHGEKVAVIGPNSPGWIIAYFAVISAGATAVPIDNLLGASEVARQLKASGVKFAFVSHRHLEALGKESGLKKVRFFLLDKEKGKERIPGWESLLAKRVRKFTPVKEDQTASLLFTSGTTGLPKGVPLSHKNIMSNVHAIAKARVTGPGDRVLLPLPLHHAYPFTVGLLGTLSSGATLILPEGATGPALQKALKAGKATVMLAVPRLLEALLEVIEARVRQKGEGATRVYKKLLALSIAARRLFGVRIGRRVFRQLHENLGPNLRVLGSGGARLDTETAWKLEGLGWRVLSGYGLSETSPILTFNVPGQSRLGTAGRPVPGVEVKVAAKPDEEQGEILVKGPGVFKGYLKDPEKTKTAFTTEGWFRTGDLGFVDQAGYLHVVGRAKEVIVLSSGENILPEDVEGAYEQTPIFKEVGILEQNGALAGLFVLDLEALKKEGAGRAPVLVKETIEGISRELPLYKRITNFRVVREDLPRTHLGKLKRHQLDLIWQKAGRAEKPKLKRELTKTDKALLEKSPAGEVWEWLEDRYRGKAIIPDTSFQLDLGLDSLAWVALTLELEDQFNIELSDKEISRIVTIRDLLQMVLTAKKSKGRGASVRAALTPDQAKWLTSPGLLRRAGFYFLYGLSWFFMRLLFRLKVKGRENLPREGAFLIAPRHTSTLDPVALIAALPLSVVRRVYWAGWAPHLFSSAWKRFLSHGAKVFPVDPNRRPMATLAFGLEVLGRGDPLVMFPEGERARTREILPFKGGTGMMLKETNARAVPVFITGTLEALPRDTLVPKFHPISVVFGQARSVKELEALGKGESKQERISEGLRKSLLALKGRNGS